MLVLTKQKILVISVLIFTAYFYFTIKWPHHLQESKLESKSLNDVITQGSSQEDSIDRFSRLIFVGGSLRSGTTLMRTMIESHPDIKCGPETGIIPHVLQLLDRTAKDIYLEDTGLTKPKNNDTLSVSDAAGAKFIFELIHELNKPSKYYCTKDPYDLEYTGVLERLFPNCKLVLMVRDFRAIAQSFHEKELERIGLPSKFRDTVIYLNNLYGIMVPQCNASKNCIIQQYEQLVLQPIKETQKLFKFFDIPWTEQILKHDKHLDEIKFNRAEFTTEQVKKPLYLDGLTKWVGNVPWDVVKDLPHLAPMMTKLGYDVTQAEPNYGEADDFVMKRGMWKEDSDIVEQYSIT